MPLLEDSAQTHLTTLHLDGGRYSVSVRTTFDGIEFVGKLWFTDEALGEPPLRDRASLPGRTRDESIALARRLTEQELTQRFRRAMAEKRRFLELRRTTDEVLAKIRYINQVTISMRSGLLDVAGASQELEITEQQLHDLVSEIRTSAGQAV
jgi:hypothetical protein